MRFEQSLTDYIYFDHNATSFFDTELRKNAYNLPLNASSVHAFGRKGKEIIEKARNSVLESVNGVEKYNLTFFSSGTEANNTIIKGFMDRVVICSETEHLSVLKPSMESPRHELIEVDAFGMVDLNKLEYLLQNNREAFVSVIYANNETGVINDISSISHLCKKYNALLHTDAIQAYGKVNLDLSVACADFATINCHKIGGPQGVAALISRKNVIFPALLKGGGQEKGKRAGTENVEAIDMFGRLAENITSKIEVFEKTRELTNYLEDSINKIAPGSVIIKKDINRLPNTVVISMKNVRNDLQLIHFDLEKIAISAGSACSSGRISNSYVLTAMGLNEQIASSSIRVSFGPTNTKQEVSEFISKWENMYNKFNMTSDMEVENGQS